MKIAVWHDAPPGGARRALEELVGRLASQAEVDVYHYAGVERPPRLTELVHAWHHQPVPVSRPHRRGLAYWNDWLLYQDLRDMWRSEEAVAATIDQGGYDVAFVSVQRSCQAPGVLRYLQTPSLYFMQEPPLRRMFEPWCRPEAAPLSLFERSRGYWRWPSRWLLDRAIYQRDVGNARQATRLLANSRYTARRVTQVYGRPAAVNYYGVDCQRFRPAPQLASGRQVLSVGALEAHKGFDFLIRALGHIPADRRPTLTIAAIAGHPRLPDHLQRLAGQHQVQLTIRRGLGREERGSDDGLVSLYQSTPLFVFGAHFEPIPLVISEAMACGLPVVAVAEGGVPELVRDGETGLLVERDEAEFAAAVDQLLTNTQRRTAMGQAARRLAETMRWTDSAQRLHELLAATAADRPGHEERRTQCASA